MKALLLSGLGFGTIQASWLAGSALTGAPVPVAAQQRVHSLPPVTAPVSAPVTAPVSAPVSALEAAVDAALLPGLASPVIDSNPAPFTVVNLATWLWVDPSVWQPVRESLVFDGVAVSAAATPTRVLWDLGDSHDLVCDGPGVPYDQGIPPEQQST